MIVYIYMSHAITDDFCIRQVGFGWFVSLVKTSYGKRNKACGKS